MTYKTAPIVLIIALLSVSVFGFLGMAMVGHEGSPSCLFATMGGELCAPILSPAAVAGHHLDMLRWLSGALASFDIIALIFLFSLPFLFAVFVVPFSFPTTFSTVQRLFVSTNELFVREAQALLEWLIYHSKRDQYALARVHLMNVRFKI